MRQSHNRTPQGLQLRDARAPTVAQAPGQRRLAGAAPRTQPTVPRPGCRTSADARALQRERSREERGHARRTDTAARAQAAPHLPRRSRSLVGHILAERPEPLHGPGGACRFGRRLRFFPVACVVPIARPFLSCPAHARAQPMTRAVALTAVDAQPNECALSAPLHVTVRLLPLSAPRLPPAHAARRSGSSPLATRCPVPPGRWCTWWTWRSTSASCRLDGRSAPTTRPARAPPSSRATPSTSPACLRGACAGVAGQQCRRSLTPLAQLAQQHRLAEACAARRGRPGGARVVAAHANRACQAAAHAAVGMCAASALCVRALTARFDGAEQNSRRFHATICEPAVKPREERTP